MPPPGTESAPCRARRGPAFITAACKDFSPALPFFAQPREEDTAAHRCRRGIRVESLDPPGETMADLYLEDFEVGQVFRGTRRVRVDAADIARFAAEYDPQPFHLDEVVAKESVFKGLAASGWHTAALTMRLLVGSDLRVAGGLIGLGFEELRWPRPVRPGDELRVESEVLEKRESKSRPQQGLLKMRNSTLNQRDEVVQVSVGTLIVPRRRPGPAAD
jgi:acyl dehydratase